MTTAEQLAATITHVERCKATWEARKRDEETARRIYWASLVALMKARDRAMREAA